MQLCFFVAETRHACTVGRGFKRAFGVVRCVVVDYYLAGVDVAFARAHHICSRVFKHRHQERYDVRLRVEILHGLEYSGALPFPAVQLRLEVPAVALPHGDIGAVKTLRRFRGVVAGYK